MEETGKISAGSNFYPLPNASSGFTYIALLIFIAIMGVVLASVGEVWHMAMRREKEKELLFIGTQYRQALDQYSSNALAGSTRYPMSLEDLLKDPRYPNTKRYLRKLFSDPITGSANWGLFKGPSGEIFGIYSLSEDEPIKKHNFNLANANFEEKVKYSEWVFMSTSKRFGARVPRNP